MARKTVSPLEKMYGRATVEALHRNLERMRREDAQRKRQPKGVEVERNRALPSRYDPGQGPNGGPGVVITHRGKGQGSGFTGWRGSTGERGGAY